MRQTATFFQLVEENPSQSGSISIANYCRPCSLLVKKNGRVEREVRETDMKGREEEKNIYPCNLLVFGLIGRVTFG